MCSKQAKPVTLAELVAERDRLVALKAWGPRLAEVERAIKDKQPVELAQDAYYYGTAADLRKKTK